MHKGYGYIPPEKRGLKFSFYINDEYVSTTTTTTEGTTITYTTGF